MGESIPPEDIIPLMQKYNLEHFVQVDRDDFIYDLFAGSIMLQKPTAFIKNPLPFFINHFKPDPEKNPVRSSEFTFNQSPDKAHVLAQLADFLQGHRKTSNFIESVHMIADEMIMNALYNAPVDNEGKPMYMDVDRAETVELPDSKTAKIFVTHDEKRLLIGCEDPFGTVNRFKIMNQFAKVYRKATLPSPNEGTGGAGLGCKMMIDHSCDYYMVVQKGVKTLVCCALPLGVSFTKAARMPKNLHIVFF